MKIKTLILTAVSGMAAVSASQGAHIWINEFHYDNSGADVDEFVEVALSTPNASGFTASDYAIEFYNGSNGTEYATTTTLDMFMVSAPQAIAGSTDTITFYTLFVPGIQNGAPDGLALVNVTNGTVESFLSYEGVFAATDGTAMGLTSTDVGVAEDNATDGTSVSASGTGFSADEFDAGSFIIATTATPGAINEGQTFSAAAIPEPSTALLSAIGALALLRRRR